MKKVLGKGLNALIPDSYVNEEPSAEVQKETPSGGHEPEKPVQEESKNHPFQVIPVSRIVPNVDQPRQMFSEAGINELAASIKEKGILQPIIVKRLREDSFMLVCGERRLRAAEKCGLVEVPAIIKDIAGSDLLEWALIENIQREDLNPIEEAQAYQRLIEEKMISHDSLAKRIGKDRSTVANTLRLLRLPEDIHSYIAAGQISAGHARAILGLLTPEHQRQMAKKIVQDNLSVRQVEAIVTRSNAQKRRAKSARHLAPEIVDLEHRLAQQLGTQVRVYPRKNQKSGRLEIHYYSLDDLDRVLDKLGLVQR